MLGAIIGDIAGSRFEFGKPPQSGFQLFVDSPDCDYTDDTILTIAIADAIINHRDYGESLYDWGHRYPAPLGCYGTGFGSWLESPNPQPYNSCGNGSAMRVSPVGWLFHDYHEVMEQARLSAMPSHNHPEGVKGAQCVATIIYWLRTGRMGRDDVEAAVRHNFGYEIPPLADINKIGSEGHFDAICQETVPWAVRCFVDSENFEDAIRKAVMADGDTDTKANITGAMAEAYYGIPDDMLDKVVAKLPDDMLDVLEQFLTLVQKEVE